MKSSFLLAPFTHQEDARTQVWVMLAEFVAALQIFLGDNVGIQQPVHWKFARALKNIPER